MPRLPQLQKMYIGPAQEVNTTSIYSNISNSLYGLAQVGLKIQKAKDSTSAISELSDFKLKMLEETDNLKVKYADNPAKFQEESQNLLNKNKENLLNNTQVSFLSKGEFKNLVDNSILDYEAQLYNDKRVLEVQKAKSDIDTSISNLNTLAYRYGQEGNFTEFDKLQNQELSKISLAGQNILSKNQLDNVMQKTKQQTYSNYLEGQMLKNPELVLNELSTRKYDDILGGDNLQRLEKNSKVLKNRINSQIKDGVDEQTIFNGNQNVININSKLEAFGIKKDNETQFDKITNKEFNNIQSVSQLNNLIDNSSNTLSKSEYNKYKTQVNNLTYSLMQSNSDYKIENKKGFFNSTLNANDTILQNMNLDLPQYDSQTKSQTYLNVMSKAQAQGIDIKSKNPNDISIVNDIYKQEIAKTYNIMPDDKDFDVKIRQKVQQKNQEITEQILQNAILYKNPNPNNLIIPLMTKK